MEKYSFIDVMKTRRSIRRFLDKQVKKNDLEQMLDAARLSPCGGNLQGWFFIVVQQRGVIDGLKSAIQKQIKELPEIMKPYNKNSEYLTTQLAKRFRSYSLFFSSAPTVIVVLYKPNPYNKPYLDFLMQTGLDRYEAYQCMGYVEIQSVAAATENLILAAHSLGYGSCWMSVPFIAMEEIKTLLSISHPWEISAFVPIGYPDLNEPVSNIKKKRLDEIVSYR